MNFATRIATLLLAAALAACTATRTQEGTGEFIDDSIITTRVKAAIFDEASLRSMEIRVETFKGIVQLSGFVSTRASIDKAVEIARRIPNVIDVRNDMRLK